MTSATATTSTTMASGHDTDGGPSILGANAAAHPSVPASAGSPSVGVILQSLCHLHRWTRTQSDLHVYERADRLRSIRLGIAVAHGRLSQSYASAKGKERECEPERPAEPSTSGTDALEDLLGSLTLSGSAGAPPRTSNILSGYPFCVSSTLRRLALDSPAVALAHGPQYATQLLAHIRSVAARHAAGESEVPEPLSQGDLYLCERSLEALEGALGACCQAVDEVCAPARDTHGRGPRPGPGQKRFASVRPPGHHCETENAMGFCWLNNVAVAAAHAYLEHGVDKVVILDIDLHHGNGTQEIVWRLNALAHKQLQALAAKKNASPRKGSPKKPTIPPEDPRPPLQLFYGSLHDVNSYPCEELDPALIAAASLSIDGQAGGQYIRNVHLESYTTPDEFHFPLYSSYAAALFPSALSFLRKTRAEPTKTLVFVSAGFDASEHEYQGMSRHGRKVPTDFYRRFGRDVAEFADAHAGGKLVAVLEGGYSLRALSTGVGSLLRGFVDPTPYAEYQKEQGEDWWDAKLLTRYERLLPPSHTAAFQAAKPRAGYTHGSGRKAEVEEAWFSAVRDAFERMEEAMPDRDPPAPAAPALRTVKVEDNETVPSAATRQTRSRAATPAATPTQLTKKTVAPPVPPTVPKVEQPAVLPVGAILSDPVGTVAVSALQGASVEAGLQQEEGGPGHEAVQPAAAGAAAPDEGAGVTSPPTGSATQELQTNHAQREAIATSSRPGKPLVRFTFKAGAIAPPPAVVTP